MGVDVAAIHQSVREQVSRAGAEHVVVAYSGGIDSTVLLHMLSRIDGLALRACHIEHGLLGQQPDWRTHVEQSCAALSVPLDIIALQLREERGESVEAMARAERYRALEGLPGKQLIVLAQHQDDQAETLLLQLLRGSGPAGLAAMPEHFPLGAHHGYRPLLGLSRDAIADYAMQHKLSWYDDPSNTDHRFDRNFLRQQVMPELQARWPGASATLARATRWQSESQAVLEQTAARDARGVGWAAPRLSIQAMQRLPAVRQRNLLRFLLKSLELAPAPGKRVDAMLGLVQQTAARGEVAWANVRVRRYRDGLFIQSASPEVPENYEAFLTPDEWHRLPGSLGLYRLRLQRDWQGTWRCALRVGGERLRARADGPSMALARWFQDRDVPPWERQRQPLLLLDGDIAAVGSHVLPRFDGLKVDWRKP